MTENLALFVINFLSKIEEADKIDAEQIEFPLTKAQLTLVMAVKAKMESDQPGKFAFIFSENYDALTIRNLEKKKN